MGAMYSLSEVSRQIGVSRWTVADIVKKCRIVVVRHPSNGKAKGVTERDFERIKRAWEATAIAAK
jgi:hypothetical protein